MYTQQFCRTAHDKENLKLKINLFQFALTGKLVYLRYIRSS